MSIYRAEDSKVVKLYCASPSLYVSLSLILDQREKEPLESVESPGRYRAPDITMDNKIKNLMVSEETSLSIELSAIVPSYSFRRG